jgi:hypothetical protein
MFGKNEAQDANATLIGFNLSTLHSVRYIHSSIDNSCLESVSRYKA